MSTIRGRLALLHGTPVVSRPLPHEVWPPDPTDTELADLTAQRSLDISIRGRSGPIRTLEDDFRRFLDDQVRWAITFNSGTSALLSAYFALGVGPGVEVVGPALTYHAALSPVHVLQGDVRLADIDIRTRGLDPVDLERAITPRTKVITVVHQWGHPADMEAIMDIASRNDLAVLEDCSHAHGSRYKGRLCGTFGDAAVFSLQANKAVFAGEGGILVTNDPVVHDRATLLGHYRERCREEVTDDSLRDFWVTGFGLKLRMSPFNAIVARHSLADFPARKVARHRCLTYLGEVLQEVPYLEPVHVGDDADMGAWYGYKPIYTSEALCGVSCGTLIEALRAEGVDVSAPSGPDLATLPLYSAESSPLFIGQRKVANDPSAHPNAAFVARNALSFPTFTSWPDDKDVIDQYSEAFQKILDNAPDLVRYERENGPASHGMPTSINPGHESEGVHT